MICFETSLKVRTYECDSYGHVNHANFLNYCEVARIEFLAALGYDLKGLMKDGLLLPIVKIEIEYKQPAYANQELRLTLEWLNRGKSSAVFRQDIYNKEKNSLVARVHVTWVSTDLRGKPITIPEELIQRYKKFTGRVPPQKLPTNQNKP
jgi:YbgC/YbaW family acyl-CoA thioester hydrolase